MPDIPLDQILADPAFNCRGEIDPASVRELAASMAAQGLIQPILVIPHTSPAWKVVAGHRRVAAARLLKWETMPAIRLQLTMTDRECRKTNLQENMARKDLTPSQEMRAIVDIYGDKPDTAAVARDLGMSRKWVRDRVRLRTMEKRILDKVDKGMLGALDLQYLCAALPEERWNLAKRLMEATSTRAVACELKLRKKARTMTEMRKASQALSDLGMYPHWTSVLEWCRGDMGSEKFFGVGLDKLEPYGILR
jgi:ParB family chromosome partitioning protein